MEEKKDMSVDTGAGGVKSVKMDFPSNSKTVKEEKSVKKVVKGRVIKQKKSLKQKFVETFIGEDIENVSYYIIHDVLVPAAKSTISDMVQGGIDMLLFGERRGSRTYRDKNRSYVSYDRYNSSKRPASNGRREVSNRDRAKHNFSDLIFETRGEAEEVLSNLVDLTIDYGQATVSDLYDLSDITSEFTDSKYGWTDLGSASVTRVREGYILTLPRPKLVD